MRRKCAHCPPTPSGQCGLHFPGSQLSLYGSGGPEVPHGQGRGHLGGTLSNRLASHAPCSDFAGALDFEHIEEQAEGIFGGRKVSFQ